MYDIRDSFRDIRLVLPDDPDYVGFMRRMADTRPTRGGPRSAGEYLGGLVERCVRRWLEAQVPLQEERILAWSQRQRNGRVGPMFRELDAVWRIDTESLCIYEMKLTYPDNMRNGTGIKQLNIASDILLQNPENKYVLKRLVYVETEKVQVLEEVPEVAANEEFAELGVIWIPVDAVEQVAAELEIELPENWRTDESREGFIEDPERDTWKEFASTETKVATSVGSSGVVGDGAEFSENTQPEIDPNSPLALALKRAIQK